MTGIDLIAADVSDLAHKLQMTPMVHTMPSIPPYPAEESGLSPSSLSAFTSGLQSCISNIRNTNAFMLMTINRCLDYTKASNGLKLVPKNETIDLAETLKMPLQCMTNIQQKIKICLMPYGEQGICSHVITDKQWLQENVLCLLSNAVKYSAGGEVVIKVTRLSRVEGAKLGEAVNRLFLTDKVCGTVEDEVISADRDESYNRSPKNSLRSMSSGWLKGGSSHVADDRSRTTKKASTQSRYVSKVVPIVNDVDTSDHEEARSDSLAQVESEKLNCEGSVSSKSTEETSDKTYLEELMFEVIDTGIGMSEEAMKTLFNPFKQTQRLAGGTGLGLYSLAKRIEALKGKYGVHQREDGKQGSVFWFTVPYKPDNNTALHRMQSKDEMTVRRNRNSENSPVNTTRITVKNHNPSPNSVKTVNHNEELRILLAEDTPSIAKMTSMMLRRQHHQTAVAENGQIALDMLYKSDFESVDSAEGRYDVVLMDLQMPVMDGLEATRRIRAHEREMASKNKNYHHHQIVIGVSANSDHETMEEALKAGIDDFLPKPFSVDAFLEVVKRIQVEWKN